MTDDLLTILTMSQSSQFDPAMRLAEDHLANFQNSLIQAGLSNEVAKQHTEKLSEIIALTVMNRVVDDHGPDVFAAEIDETERQRVVNSLYTPEQLVELVKQEGMTQITLYFQALSPSLDPDKRTILASQLGISI